MKKVALFYNFSDDKLRRAKFALMPLKIAAKGVEKQNFNQPVGYLVGIKGIEPQTETYSSSGFDDEMLVMYNFVGKDIEQLIKALARYGVGTIPLKAVVTPVNKDWDSVRLYNAISAEHEAMTKTR